MMDEIHLHLEANPTREDLRHLRAAQRAEDLRAAPLQSYARAEILIIARDAAGHLSGGALGVLDAGWLFVDILWVHPAQRASGLGTQLMIALEQEALARGAEGVYLFTTTFQAVGFYEKLGYKEFARVDERPPGYSTVYYQKHYIPAQPLPALFEVQSPGDPAIVSQLDEALRAHAETYAPLVIHPLAIYLRDAEDKLCGGLFGVYFWNWFDIQNLWVLDTLRGQGYGLRLMDALEEALRAAGGVGITAEVASYQRMGFFLRAGFEAVGKIDNRPPDYSTYLMRKNL